MTGNGDMSPRQRTPSPLFSLPPHVHFPESLTERIRPLNGHGGDTFWLCVPRTSTGPSRPPSIGGEIDTDTLDYTEVHDGAPPAPLMAQTMAAVKATTKPGPDCRYRRDGLCNCPDGECFADEVGIDNGTGDSDA